MGCDIHAMVERKGSPESTHWWVNRGDPEIGRNYQLFSILAGVRGSYRPISEPRGLPEDKREECSDAFKAWLAEWGGDAHDASWVTLRELKDYLNAVGTCGDCGLFELAAYMQREVAERYTDKDVRLCFFFDN